MVRATVHRRYVKPSIGLVNCVELLDHLSFTKQTATD